MNKVYALRMMPYCFLILISMLVLLSLPACVFNGDNSNNGSVNKTTRTFYFADMGAIPLVSGSNSNYQLSLFNDDDSVVRISATDVTLIGAKLKSNTTVADMIETKECNTIQPHGQCVIRINLSDKLADDTGEFGLQITGHRSQGDDLKAVSVISYFTPNKSTNLIYSTVGVGQFYIKEPRLININIPLYFRKDYTRIRLKSSNPNIQYELLDCTNEIVASTACTLRVSFMGGTEQNGLIEFIGQLKSASSGTTPSSLFSLTVSNSLEEIGHMLLGTTSSSIVEDGKDNVTLTLVNNGNGTIKDIKLSLDNDSILKVMQNNCTNDLNVGMPCSIVLNTVPSEAPSSIVSLNIKYSNGQKTASVDYSIIVKPESGRFGIIDAAIGSDFKNTPVGFSRFVTINYSNKGNAPINDFGVEASGYFPDGMKGSNNGCLIKKILAPGDKCEYTIEYNPLTIVDPDKIKLSASGKYNSDGVTISISNPSTIEYSSYNSSTNLHFSPEILNFNTPISKPINKTLTVENFSNAVVENIGFTVNMENKDHNVDYKIVKGTSGGVEDCLNKKNLQAHEVCTITIQFLPTTKYVKDNGILAVDFTISGQSGTNKLPIQSNAMNNVAQVIANNISAKGQDMGSGLINDPYVFNTLNGNDGEIFIEYQNIGGGDAKNFSVSNALPIGYTTNADEAKSSCPTNGSMGQLPPGQKCILAITGYNPEINDFISKDSAININIPSVSYTDENNNVIEQGDFGIIYSKFNALNNGSISVSSTAVEEINGDLYYTNSIDYIITKSSTKLPVKFSIVSPQGATGLVFFQSSTDGDNNYCNIGSGEIGSSCSVKMYYQLIPINLATKIEVNNLYWQYGKIIDDITQPKAILVSPSKDIGPNDTIKIKFSNPIKNLSSNNLHIKKDSEDGAEINFTVTPDQSNKEFAITPQKLLLSTNYYVVLSDDIVDKYEKHFEKSVFSIQTRVANYVTPTLVSPNVTVNVSRNTDIVIGFGSDVSDCNVLNNHITLKENGNIIATSVTDGTDKQTCKVIPQTPIKSNMGYSLLVDGKIDISEIATTVETAFAFSTSQDIKINPALIKCTTDANYKNITLFLNFDHEVNPDTVNPENLFISGPIDQRPQLKVIQDSLVAYRINFNANEMGPGTYSLLLNKVCNSYGDCIASDSTLNFKLGRGVTATCTVL